MTHRDWLFRYLYNPRSLMIMRAIPPLPATVFHPHAMSDWLRSRGDAKWCSHRITTKVQRPKRPADPVA